MRHLLPVLLLAGCASHALEVSQTVERPSWEAWVWASDGQGTFLLTTTSRVASELAELAPETGYALRPATADDFRESWPVLEAVEVPGAHGSFDVRYDLRAADHVALTNFWVELMVVRETRRAELNRSAEQFVRSAVHSTRP